MGWKSTITISRLEAIGLIMDRVSQTPNEELSKILDAIGYGDKLELPYYGHNFNVVNEKPNNDTDDE